VERVPGGATERSQLGEGPPDAPPVRLETVAVEEVHGAWRRIGDTDDLPRFGLLAIRGAIGGRTNSRYVVPQLPQARVQIVDEAASEVINVARK
jgi:hypothetical protein